MPSPPDNPDGFREISAGFGVPEVKRAPSLRFSRPRRPPGYEGRGRSHFQNRKAAPWTKPGAIDHRVARGPLPHRRKAISERRSLKAEN